MAKRILFDAGPMLDLNKTGVGYYVQGLVQSLRKTYPNDLKLTGYYFNFLHRKNKVAPSQNRNFYEIWLIPGKLLALCRRLGFQPALENFMRIPKGIDWIVFTNYVSLPLLKKRKVALIVYDLGFLDVPHFTQTINLHFLSQFCPPSIRRADIIITISEFTKQRLVQHFPDLQAKIIVTPIPPPLNNIHTESLGQNLLDKGISKNSYILYIGTVEPRKNLEKLIEAYSQLDSSTRSRYSLVLAGGKGWKDDAILAAVAKQQANGLDIILTGYVSDSEKAALYRNAACFVLPSHYEGFGMPILEAMQYGLAVITSDIAVFHEVAGNAALYFDKDDAGDMAHKITICLTDQSLRNELIARSKIRLQAISWKDNAIKVYEALQ